MAEEWRVVPSLPDYEASDLGRIRRATAGRGTYIGRIAVTPPDSEGYLTLGTSRGPKRVHRLVAEAFHGPIPPGGEVHHINEDRADPRAENLEVRSSKLAHHELHRRVRFDRRRAGEPNPAIPCGCGCGRTFLKFDQDGRSRRFVSGHNGVRRAV